MVFQVFQYYKNSSHFRYLRFPSPNTCRILSLCTFWTYKVSISNWNSSTSWCIFKILKILKVLRFKALTSTHQILVTLKPTKFFETFDTYRNFKEPKSFKTPKNFKRSKVRTQDSRFKICQGLRKFQLSNHVRGDSNFPCHVWMFDTIPNVSARIATCSMKGHCQRERAWSCVHTFNTVTFTDREPRWLRKSRSSAASFFC